MNFAIWLLIAIGLYWVLPAPHQPITFTYDSWKIGINTWLLAVIIATLLLVVVKLSLITLQYRWLHYRKTKVLNKLANSLTGILHRNTQPMDWHALFKNLPTIHAASTLHLDSQFSLSTMQLYFATYWLSLADDPQTKKAIFSKLPKYCQQDASLFKQYIESLVSFNETNTALKLVYNYLEKNWQPLIIDLYGKLYSSDLSKQIKLGEKWLATKNQDPHLRLALGRLCAKNNLWGKAIDYIESSLAIQYDPESSIELLKIKQLAHTIK